MLDLLTAAPKAIQFGAWTLLVGPLKLRELGLLQRWIRDHSERPTARLKATLDLYPEDEHRALKKAAVQADHDWPPAIGTAEGNEVLFADLDGQMYFLGVMLRKYQPDLQAEDLDQVARGLSPDDFGLLTMIAFGEDDFDPLALRAAAAEHLARLREHLLETVAALAAGSAAPTGGSSSATSG